MLNLNTNWVTETIKYLHQWWPVVKSNFQAIQLAFNNHIDGTAEYHSASAITNDSEEEGETVSEALNSGKTKLANHIAGTAEKHASSAITNDSEEKGGTVSEALNSGKTKLENHIAGTANKHASDQINYSGSFVGKLNVKAALDQAKLEIDSIASEGSIDPEVALARNSSVKGKSFITLDARLEESEQGLIDLNNSLSTFETTTGSQAKADTAEAAANGYTDGVVNEVQQAVTNLQDEFTSHTSDNETDFNAINTELSVIRRNNLKALMLTSGFFSGINQWSNTFENANEINAALSTGYVHDSTNKSIKVSSSSSSNLCTGGTAISSGDKAYDGTSTYVKENAFDATATAWGSSQTGSGVNGVAFIGYVLSVAKEVRKISITEWGGGFGASSVKVQYSDNGTTWTDLQTLSVNPDANSIAQEFALNAGGAHRYWRLLANNSFSTDVYWAVMDLKMFEATTGLEATIILNQVLSEYALNKVVIEADILVGTGTAHFYISRDGGTTYTECPLDTIVDISSQPAGESIVVKIVLTGNAELQAMAWGEGNILTPASMPNTLTPHFTTWSAIGDSITAGGEYIAKIKTLLGITTAYNYGVGGTTIAKKDGSDTSCMSVRFANITKNVDLITVFGGTNDLDNNIPLGTNSDTTNTTFKGALNVMFQGLISQNPTSRIVIFTPIQRSVIYAPGANGLVNGIGLTLLDYVKAEIELAEMYSIPVIDLYGNVGISVQNITTYTTEGVHPNDAGYTKIAKYAANTLKTL